MTDIRRLDDATVDRIAAGEVVERPAAVVKELIENSVDAGAARIDVTVEGDGTDRILVSDDGHGMSGDDLELAVAEHATSKIDDVDDLAAGVATLGFRGEALHAIGAVATLTIRSREQGATRGTELRVDGGETTERTPVGCPEGTTVIVEDLFRTVPARRKYLKSEATEFARINRVVSGYALANPDIAVSLTHDGRETFATEGGGDLRSAVMAVYGREVAANMIGVGPTRSRTDGNTGDIDADAGPLAGVRGLVSHPETNRASRDYVNVFVNGRWVTAGAVREAVVAAYGRQLASDRYPFAVIDLDVDPSAVDVNVHPRKLEVRFADEDEMKQQVREAIESALLAEGLIRTSAPRGQSKAEQTTIEQSSGVSDPDADAVESMDAAPDTQSVDSTRRSGESDASAGTTHHSDASPPADTGASTPDRATGSDSGTESKPGTRFQPAPTQHTLDGGEPDRTFDRLPPMRVLGQLQDTYIIAEADDGLLLIDQHAADERVNYERLRERFDGDVTTQTLATPIDVSLTATEAAVAEPARETLARLGFTIERVDDRTVRVQTVPALLADEVDADLVRDLLGDVAAGEPDRTVEAAVDDLLGDLACYPAIKGNSSLTVGSVTALLSALDGCENPYACPHGRPVVVEMDRDEIEARFERDYPGHGG